MSPVTFTLTEQGPGLILTYQFPSGWYIEDFFDVWNDVHAVLATQPEKPVIAIWLFAAEEGFSNVHNMTKLVRRTSNNAINARVQFTYVVFAPHGPGRIVLETMCKVARALVPIQFDIVDDLPTAQARIAERWV
jgi:hypothetical protein